MAHPTLQNPTVDLFLYDLQDGLGESSVDIDQRRRQLWQGILNGQLTKSRLREIEEREKTTSNYIELLPERLLPFAHPYDGYYYPVKLGDTLSIQVDCSGKPHEPTWSKLSFEEQLQEIKSGILQHTDNKISGEMGRSWLVWGQLNDPDQSSYETAVYLYENLKLFPSQNWKRDYKGKGCFEGTTLFEMESPDLNANGINQTKHVIICLFPFKMSQDERSKIIGKLYRNLIRVFCYRNKILWVYEQSFQLKMELKTEAEKVQRLVDSIPSIMLDSTIDLNRLQKDLASALTLSQAYETKLGYLKEKAIAIKVNIDNYVAWLEKLEKLASECDLEFLRRFETLAREKYLVQIDTDQEILAAGFKPLENYTKTVAGIIDIEHSKNERKLNLTIASASAGLGAASLMAATFNDQAKQLVAVWMPPPQGQTQPPVASYLASTVLAFGVSASMGVLFAWLTYRLLRRRG